MLIVENRITASATGASSTWTARRCLPTTWASRRFATPRFRANRSPVRRLPAFFSQRPPPYPSYPPPTLGPKADWSISQLCLHHQSPEAYSHRDDAASRLGSPLLLPAAATNCRPLAVIHLDLMTGLFERSWKDRCWTAASPFRPASPEPPSARRSQPGHRSSRWSLLYSFPSPFRRRPRSLHQRWICRSCPIAARAVCPARKRHRQAQRSLLQRVPRPREKGRIDVPPCLHLPLRR